MGFARSFQNVRKRDRSRDPEAYRRSRLERLHQVLTTAQAHVPIYRDRISTDIADFTSFGTLDKQSLADDLLASLNQSITSDLRISDQELLELSREVDSESTWIANKVNLTRTSGTSGLPIKIFRTNKELEAERALEIARQNLPGSPLLEYLRWGGFRLAAILHDSPSSAAWQRFERMQTKLKRLAKFLVLSIYDNEEDIVQKLSDFAPHHLVSYPVPLASVARLKLAGQGLHLNPKVITSGADSLLAADRELLKEAFPSTRIREHYGAVECSSMAFSCQQGSLHLNEDYCILEVMSKDNQQVADGHWGDHILVTSLVRHLQPIIRYRIEDRVRYTGIPCICGSPLAVIEIEGRRFPDFVLVDDQDNRLRVSAYVLRKALEAPWIHRYQVLQTGKLLFDVRIAPRHPHAKLLNDELAALKASLQGALKKVGAPDVSFTFTHVGSSDFLKLGHKVKQFIPLHPQR